MSTEKREQFRNIIDDDDDYERFIDIEQRVDNEKLLSPLSLGDVNFLLRLFYRVAFELESRQ